MNLAMKSQSNQGTSHSFANARGRTDQRHSPLSSFAFPLVVGSPNSLAKIDLSDVGSLSCRVTFKPVSPSLQGGIRFFRLLKPAPPLGSPCGSLSPASKLAREGYGVSTFHF